MAGKRIERKKIITALAALTAAVTFAGCGKQTGAEETRENRRAEAVAMAEAEKLQAEAGEAPEKAEPSGAAAEAPKEAEASVAVSVAAETSDSGNKSAEIDSSEAAGDEETKPGAAEANVTESKETEPELKESEEAAAAEAEKKEDAVQEEQAGDAAAQEMPAEEVSTPEPPVVELSVPEVPEEEDAAPKQEDQPSGDEEWYVSDAGNPNGDRYVWSDVIGSYVDTAPWGTGEFAYVPELGIWVELPGEDAAVYTFSEPEPEEMYSDEEVMQIVEAAFRNAGLRKPEDYMTPEELERFGVTDGMGWAESRVSRLKSKTQMHAESILEFYAAYDYNFYYLEFVSSDAEWVIIRGYYGSDHPG